MALATLEIKDLGKVRQCVVDCPHATTTVHGVDGGIIGDRAIVAFVLLRHHAAEGCVRTAELRCQYPPSLLLRTLWVAAE